MQILNFFNTAIENGRHRSADIGVPQVNLLKFFMEVQGVINKYCCFRDVFTSSKKGPLDQFWTRSDMMWHSYVWRLMCRSFNLIVSMEAGCRLYPKEDAMLLDVVRSASSRFDFARELRV